MKNILITGAGGFIGSHLTELCVDLGYNVVAFDHYNSNNSWGWLNNSKVKNDIEMILGDIRDYDSVYNAMKNCDTVIHLAALISIPYSYISPLAYLRTNVEGTYNILESARHLTLNQILVTSSSETYGSAQYAPIDENHPLVAHSPYSASKIGADQFAVSYYRSFNQPIKIVRPFNTYGPRQSARAVIPSVITQILKKETRIKLGNVYPTRDLTYVEDLCSGFIEIAKSDKLFGEVVNIGMSKEIRIDELVNKIANIMGIDIKIISDNDRLRPKTSEVDRLICDNKKLIENTNWKPVVSLESGLANTVNWMKLNMKYYKPEHYNV